MGIEQKVLAASIGAPIHATQLTNRINEIAGQGWRVQQILTMISRHGGGMYTLREGYYFDSYYVLLEKAGSPFTYAVVSMAKVPKEAENTEAINKQIGEQNALGFRLVQMLQIGGIAADPDYPTRGTAAFVLVFEKEG